MNKRFVSILLVVLIVGIAFWLRLRAASLLPIDYDEDDYLSAAIHYAAAFRDFDLQEVIDYDFNYEHPPLTKLIYGLAILPLPPATAMADDRPTTLSAASLPEPHFRVSRTVSAAFGTLEVLVLALVNPVGGLFLAIHTWQIKYTSQVMLEPLPSLTSLLVIFFYSKSNRKWNRWLFLSAAAMGLTAASKYPYTIIGCVLLAHWFTADWRQKGDSQVRHNSDILLPVLAWTAIVLVFFISFNPRLWNDPLSRLWASLVFHRVYAQSEHVRQVGFPFWQPLVWVFRSVHWHPGVYLISIDALMSLLALIGYKRLWQSYRIYALWLVFTLAFLLIWPTKWPQYVLGFTAPLSLSAALGFTILIVEPLKAVIYSVNKVANHASTRTSTGWYNRSTE